MTPQELLRRLERFPQVSLGYYPTPLEKWQRLGDSLDRRGSIYAKREDLTGLAFGGNKTRQLEFLLGEALARGADTIVHGGAVQSNYSRMLAAACAKLGLECHLVLSTVYGQSQDTGNILLDTLCGAKIQLLDLPLGPDYENEKRKLAERLRGEGRRPYLITYPQSEILGTLAYLKCSVELYLQCKELAAMPKVMAIAAVGSTQSGFLLGSHLLGWDVKILGFSPLYGEFSVKETLSSSIGEACRLLEIKPISLDDKIISITDYVGAGYSVMTDEAAAAIKKVAKLEGVFLDPVYNSKAAAGVFNMMQGGEIGSDEDVIFIHTGGNVALFAYNRQLLGLEASPGGKEYVSA